MDSKSKKELREQYKQTKQPAGVYQIRNLENGRIFLGSSLNLNAAWNSNKFQLDMGSHRNADLQSDWKLLGEQKFVFEILEEIYQDDATDIDLSSEVSTLESMYLEEILPYGEKGYNRKKP